MTPKISCTLRMIGASTKLAEFLTYSLMSLSTARTSLAETSISFAMSRTRRRARGGSWSLMWRTAITLSQPSRMVLSGCRLAVDSCTKRPVTTLRDPLDREKWPPCDTDVLGLRAAAVLLM